MQDLLDNSEMQEVLDKLENLEDEQLANDLLREFNDRTKVLGQLIMNLDKNLSSEEWKEKCDAAKKDVDEILQKIKDL
jgi:divalent metal cation (Fe/Co/Zn/Cd) transporter